MQVKVSKTKELETEIEYFCYLTIAQTVYEELFKYVDSFEGECSGCGLIEQVKHEFEKDKPEYEYKLKEIFLPNQKNTSATTNIEDSEVHSLITQLIQEDKNPEELKFHWHSHKDMSVFHSTTDTENYEDLKTGEWLVSIVINSKREIYARLDFYKPFRLSISSIPVYVDSPPVSVDDSRINANIERVKEHDKPVTTVYHSEGYYGNLYNKDRNHSLVATTGAEIDLLYKLKVLEDQGHISILYDEYDIPYGYRDLLTNIPFEISLTELQDWEIEDRKEAKANVAKQSLQ